MGPRYENVYMYQNKLLLDILFQIRLTFWWRNFWEVKYTNLFTNTMNKRTLGTSLFSSSIRYAALIWKWDFMRFWTTVQRRRVPEVITLSSLIMPIFEFQAPLIEHRVSHPNFTYQIQSSTVLFSIDRLEKSFWFLFEKLPRKMGGEIFSTCFYHHGGIRIKTNCSLILGRVCSGRVAPLIHSRLVMLQIYAISLVIPIFILVVKLTIIIPRWRCRTRALTAQK